MPKALSACLVNKDFANIFPKVLHCRFHPLTSSLSGIEQQDHFNPYRVEMASMAMIHFGLDPGKFVCFLSSEYTGQHRDIRCTLDAIQDHVTSDDYGHIKGILLDGCNLPWRNLQATSWSSYLVVIPRVLLRILSWFKKTMKIIIVIWFQWIRFFANYLLIYAILRKASS